MPHRYHSNTEWRAQLHLIARSYLDDRLSYNEIAERLSASGFVTSASSVKARLQLWKIQRTKNETELMARRFLHHQACGVSVSFRRCGVDVPTAAIRTFLEQTSTQASQDLLPEHIQEVFLEPTYGAADELRQPNGLEQPEPTAPSIHVVASLPEEFADNQLRSKRRKVSFQQVNSNYRDGSNESIETSSDDGHVNRDDTHDEGNGDDSKTDQDPDRQPHVRGEDEVKKAFALLQKVSSKDTKANEAVKHAEEVLIAALTNESTKQFEQAWTDLGPLHAAAVRGDQKTAALLLRHGADINARGGPGHTALHCAAVQGHYALVEFLLQQPDIDIDAVDNRKMTALHLAFWRPWRHVALLLIQHGANVDLCDEYQRCALHYACVRPGLALHVRDIIEQTVKLNHRDQRGRTPLHMALVYNNDEYVAPLIAAGADLNTWDEDRQTPMMYASSHASREVLSLLLAQNPDLTAKSNEGDTVLHFLCARDVYDVVQQALDDCDVEINARTTEGVTPLMVGVINGHEKTVRTLVEKRADMSLMDIYSNTALYHAIEKGFKKIAEFLIEKGSPLDPVGHSSTKWKLKLENELEAEQELSALGSRVAHVFRKPQQSRYTDIEVASRHGSQYGSVSIQEAIRFHARELADLTSKSTNRRSNQRDTIAHQSVDADAQIASNPINSFLPPFNPSDNHSPYFFDPEFNFMGGSHF